MFNQVKLEDIEVEVLCSFQALRGLVVQKKPSSYALLRGVTAMLIRDFAAECK